MQKTIFYHDTDCGGIVYYANYLKFFEEARSQLLESAGFSLKKLMELGCVFAVVKQETEYKYPVTYGEKITIGSKLLEFSQVKMIFENTVTNASGKLTTRGKTTVVCLTPQGALRTIPEDMRAALKDILLKEVL